MESAERSIDQKRNLSWIFNINIHRQKKEEEKNDVPQASYVGMMRQSITATWFWLGQLAVLTVYTPLKAILASDPNGSNHRFDSI